MGYLYLRYIDSSEEVRLNWILLLEAFHASTRTDPTIKRVTPGYTVLVKFATGSLCEYRHVEGFRVGPE